jgi:hypothetical protein
VWKDLKLSGGRDRVVRHGHGPHRAIQTGVGPVEVRRAKVRDRGDVGIEAEIRFTSSTLPKWARRTKSLDALLPVLYPCGMSTGDFQEAHAALQGKDAPNLSQAVISRLTAEWHADYERLAERCLMLMRSSRQLCALSRFLARARQFRLVARPGWKTVPNAHPGLEADEFLLGFGCRADQHQHGSW